VVYDVGMNNEQQPTPPVKDAEDIEEVTDVPVYEIPEEHTHITPQQALEELEKAEEKDSAE
jgi:hypothetical protein